LFDSILLLLTSSDPKGRNTLRIKRLVLQVKQQNDAVMKTFLFLIAPIFPLTVLAEPLFDFASVGSPSSLKFAEGKSELTVGEDGLTVDTPNAWSAGWQYPKTGLTGSPNEGAVLILTALGTTGSDSPVLQIRLLSAEWKRADVYEFPLDRLDATEVTNLPASSEWGFPIPQDEPGLEPGEAIAHIQFLLKGSGGNSPWRLQLRSSGSD